jgi:CHAT domain-containing protein
MVDFYDRLAKTGDKADALAQAQLALLASHRKESSGAAHPITGPLSRLPAALTARK